MNFFLVWGYIIIYISTTAEKKSSCSMTAILRNLHRAYNARLLLKNYSVKKAKAKANRLVARFAKKLADEKKKQARTEATAKVADILD